MVGFCDGESREHARDVNSHVLDREIRSSLSYIVNLLHTRHSHPTYGITKASLNAAVHRAEGLLVARMILNGVVNNFNTNGNPVNRYAADHFDVDLEDLKGQVKNA